MRSVKIIIYWIRIIINPIPTTNNFITSSKSIA